MRKILYVFGGEEASGAEIVIERLMQYNSSVTPMLMIAPGKYSANLLKGKKSYNIIVNERLKKLKRANTTILKYIWRALSNYFIVSYKVFQCIRSNKVDVVHANTVVPASYLIPCLIWCKLTKPRVRFVWSDHDLKYFSKLDHIMAAIVVKLYTHTFTVSNAVSAKYGLNKKVITLYNGIDVDLCVNDPFLQQQFRTLYKLPQDSKIFAIIGHIVKRKGIKELLNACRDILLQRPDIYLLVVGEGSIVEKDYFEEIVKISSGYNNVILTGRIEDVSLVYNGIDYVINNSLVEGGEPLGTTILEGQAYQRVVLASNVGGSSEIVKPDTGILYNAEDSTSLQQAFLKAVDMSEETYLQLANSARQNISNNFHIQKMVARYNAILEKI